MNEYFVVLIEQGKKCDANSFNLASQGEFRPGFTAHGWALLRLENSSSPGYS